MGITLRPVAKKSESDVFQFGVCDIESANWIDFLVIGYYSEVFDEDGYRRDEILENFENMSEFCDWIFEKDKQPHKIIFAHFGGKFDFQFILKDLYFRSDTYYIDSMIPRGSGLLCFSVSTMKWVINCSKISPKQIIKTIGNRSLIKDRTIEFRDSSAFMPFSLASITENFGVEHKKQTIDYDQIKEVTPELLEYLEYDLKGLYQCIRKYYDWPVIKAAGHASTVASQALKVYQTFMPHPIPSLKEDDDHFVRSSYFGGRTEIFKPFFRQSDPYKLLKTYDVNSLYPYIMWQNEFPGAPAFETKFYLENRAGFYDVDVYVPEHLYIPPLGTVYDPQGWGRFIFPTGTFRGKWSTIELNYAMTLGVKILKVHNGIIFKNSGPIFRDYIDYLYKLRKSSKKNSVDDILCKLLMNSLYGRFGLNTLREQIEFDYGQLGVEPHMEIPLDSQGREIIRLMKKEIILEESFNNVAIPAWVTSGGRIHMHKQYCQAPDEMFYTDTDSLFTTYEFEENEKKLGELKLEYKAKEACFLLPKTYLVDTLGPYWTGYDEKGKGFKTSKKIVMKGFDKKKYRNLT